MRIMASRCSRPVLAATFAIMAASASAQAPGGQPPAAPAPDFSKVEIKTTKISGNLYELEGQGGNIGALVGPDGVFMVDSQFAPLTEKIAAAIRRISDGRVRFVVNTHVHADHTGGNENFAKMGAIIMARDELRARLALKAPAANTQWPSAPAARPVVTYRGPVTVHMNGEDIQVIPVPAAHTDGDTLVRFPVADVLMTGDFFRSLGYPYIDRGNGGSMKGMLAGLNATIELAGPNTKVIPGHGAVTDRAGLMAHRDMFVAIRDRVSRLMQEGKTPEEVVAAKLTAAYDARFGPNADRFVGALYAELKEAK